MQSKKSLPQTERQGNFRCLIRSFVRISKKRISNPTRVTLMFFLDKQFYQKIWKKTKRKIVYSCQFINALRNVSQELDEESTHYGWTIEELQECLHQLSTSINRQRHASFLDISST
jgi:hypothetical protein